LATEFESLFSAAQVEIRSGDWLAGYDLLRRAIAAAQGGAEPDRLTMAISQCAFAAVRSGDLKAGISFAREAVARQETKGTEDKGFVEDLYNVGTFLALSEELAEARPYFERAVDMQRRLSGDDDPMTVKLSIYLAQSYVLIGAYDIGFPLIEQIFQTCQRLNYVNNIVEAVEVFTECLAQRKKYGLIYQICTEQLTYLYNIYGGMNPAMIPALLSFGKSYMIQGDFKNAEEYFNTARNLGLDLLGPDDILTASAADCLGALAVSQGQYDMALRAFNELLRVAKLNQDYSLALHAIEQACACLRATGRAEEAAWLEASANQKIGFN
jgi:tetratricopeptide (TPR) repeat protein